MWFIEFNIVLVVVVILFHQLFYKKGNINWNRWILLSFPFLFFGISYFKTKAGSFEGLTLIQYPTITINYDESIVTESIDWLSLIYIAGVLLTLLFFIYSFFTLIARIKKQEVNEKNNAYFLYQGTTNTSFFNHIIIDKNLSNDKKEIVLLHEKAHVDQKHSIDRIVVALIQCLLWFNPAVYLWGKMVVNNHEYLADEAVIQKESNESYTLFLLNQTMKTKSFNPYSLTSNMSNLKSRVMKMNGKKSPFKYTYLILPMVGLATLSFTFNGKNGIVKNTVITTSTQEPVEEPDVQPEFKGGNQAMIEYLQKEVKYPKKSMKENVQGKVFVSMVIAKTGDVTHVESLKGPNDELKMEAERVIKNMPRWTPGEKDGKEVAVKVVLPIQFKL